MNQIVHSWRISPSLQHLIDQRGGIPALQELMAPNPITHWGRAFQSGLDRLGVSPRVYNALSRAIRVSTTLNEYDEERGMWVERLVEPYVANPHPFIVVGRLLDFEEWCDAIADRTLTCDDLAIRGLGRQGWQDLLTATQRRHLSLEGDALALHKSD